MTLDDEIIIKKKTTNVPAGRYVLGITPYLNEAEYDDYYNVDMNQNDEESSNKKLPNDSLQDSNIFEKVESMNNLDNNSKNEIKID